MPITRESLETRRSDLFRQHADALAKLNAIAGAIQDTEFWLGRIDEPSVETQGPRIVADKVG